MNDYRTPRREVLNLITRTAKRHGLTKEALFEELVESAIGTMPLALILEDLACRMWDKHQGVESPAGYQLRTGDYPTPEDWKKRANRA